MAVVQISRIQHRRGRKNQGSGMPQLASAELGWAVDTQELYIGNGSVAEGAPAVGNTKILTEKDDLFSYANTYSYKPNESTVWKNNTPTQRSLQDRLDDLVSVKAFGALGNGTSDDTEALQKALDSLYLQSDTDNKVRLYIPAGVYLVSDSIRIPPFATIIGAGKDKTIIRNETGEVMTTVNGGSTPGNYNPVNTTPIYAADVNQPRYIQMQDLTIETLGNATALKIVDCANSQFENIKVKGPWAIATSGMALTKGIELVTTGSAKNINLRFNNLEVEGFEYLVYSDYDTRDCMWTDCMFYMCNNAIAFGVDTIIGRIGQTTGPMHNTIRNCKFDLCAREGINILEGKYNLSENNRFYNVGNEGGSSAEATYPVIEVANYTNSSDNDFFQRSVDLIPNSVTDLYYGRQYVPEVHGTTQWRSTYGNKITIGQKNTPTSILKFPLIHGTFFIDYMYTDTFNGLVREGTITLTMNLNLNTATVQDEYSYAGPAVHQNTLSWSTNVVNYGDFYGANPETVEVLVENTLGTSSDSFTYVIRSKN